MKKWIMGLLLVCLGLSLCACEGPAAPTETAAPITTSAPTEEVPGPEDSLREAQVRILNNDPQLQSSWEALAEEYTRLTGIDVTVVSSTEDQPTLLSVTSQEELPENCTDLSQTNTCAQLIEQALTLRNEQGQVQAVANHIEVYGLVYNSTLLAQTANTREDIGSFAELTEVVYSITDAKQTLGFSAFARVDPDAYFALQLASLTGGIRNLVELILNNTTCDPLSIEDGTTSDALQDFLDGKAVFFLAGPQEQEALNEIGSENMGVLPVYMGGENEENQSLCVAARSYWCIDAGAAAEDVQATVDFLEFLTSPRADGTVPVDDLAQMSPFRQATYVSNMLEMVLRSDLAQGKAPVICRYVSQVPEGLTEALIAYAEDPSDENWAAICRIVEQ